MEMETQSSEPAQPESSRLEERLQQIQLFLETMFRLGRFDLKAAISRAAGGPGAADGPEWVVNLSGRDTDLVLESHAALLDAFASIASKAARLEEDLHRKIVFDCDNYRDARAGEIRLMAQLAAGRVIESGEPFALDPMNSADRRIVHLALREQPLVRTESQGYGPARQVVILPAQITTKAQRR
ncbi:MAG: protein jag [Terriglobia bacterium]